LRRGGLVKTRRFRAPVYVGDPINAVKIFNEKEVDELFLTDITATAEGREPDYELVHRIASEAFMPVGYGGGVASLEIARRLLKLGVEKVTVNASAMRSLSLVSALRDDFGAQCVVGVIDVKRDLFNRPRVFAHAGARVPEPDPLAWAERLVAAGAGELVVQSVDRDGSMAGFDLELLARLRGRLPVPLLAAGGAGGVRDMLAAFRAGGLSGVAVGARFVFDGPHRAVLITYLSPSERSELMALGRAARAEAP
jgi:cyclase